MKVICFYWLGDRWQQDGMNYNSQDDSFRRHLKRVGNVPKELAERYVNNLFKGVCRYAEEHFEFICFTNERLKVDPQIKVKPFPMVTTKGVIPRMWMFSQEAGLFGEQVLCLDIDVVITGSLKDIMAYRGTFCTRLGFAGVDKGKLDGDIMSFAAGPETEKIFWKPFIEDIKETERITTGRERFWVRHVATDIADNFDHIAPKQIFSYKANVRGKGLPETARIVSCHGHPRPHQIKDKWIKDYWK